MRRLLWPRALLPGGSWAWMGGVDDASQSASLRGPLASEQDWRPDEGALDLWLVALGERTSDELETLSPDEREREARGRPAGRARFGAARLALRQVLARYVEVEPRELVFEYGEHGRPQLAAGLAAGDLDFNLSHSGSHALIALLRGGRVGVDLQRIEPARDLRGLAERFYAVAEVEALRRLEGDAFARTFFQLWSCREAYVKALGTSIAVLPSRRFGFHLEGDAAAPRARLVESAWTGTDTESVDAWRFALLDAPDGFVAAVGWNDGDRRLRAFSHGNGAG